MPLEARPDAGHLGRGHLWAAAHRSGRSGSSFAPKFGSPRICKVVTGWRQPPRLPPPAAPAARWLARGSHPGCQGGVGWLPLTEVAARRAPVDDTPVCASLDWSGSRTTTTSPSKAITTGKMWRGRRRTHNPSTPARRGCASRAALLPDHHIAQRRRRKLTSSSCCARVSSVQRVVGLAVVSVVAGRASGTLRVRITTSKRRAG